MAAAANEPRKKSEEDAIEEHEGLDAETVFEDVGELFRPDNTVIPPLNPDDPPGLANERARTNKHPVGEEQAEINRSEDSPA